MNKRLFKIAASSAIVSLTLVATTAQSEALRRASSSSTAEARAARQASEYNETARQAVREGRFDEALVSVEQAVALAPRDAGYRLLLGDVYLKQGRFDSARATFADVLELDPNNVRAGLNYSLMQVALGRPEAAIGQLETMTGHAAAADVGLALALAGAPQRAIQILEPAARAHDATPRLRQNLALAHAIAGDWRRARAIAAQDLSPADVGARMAQWAVFARPDSGPAQIAGLLGVSPVADAGQPARLALSRSPEVRLAQAEPAAEAAPVVLAQAEVPAPVAEAPAPAPVEAAPPAPVPNDVRPYYTPAPQAPAEAPQTRDEARVALAPRTLSQPMPEVARTSAVALPPAPVFQRQRPQPARTAAPAVRSGNSNYVVQLGAFSNEANAERAWVNAERRFNLGQRAPLTATINMNGRTLHRVAVSGFASQGDAARLCGSIRAGGGVCFVRANAGDASIRWAARYAPGRTRRA